MKKRNAKKSSPEEAFLRSAEERMDIELDYGRIKDQLNAEEIARIGSARGAQTANPFRTAPAKPARGPSATVVLATVLAVTTVVGMGGFLIAKQAGKAPPSVNDPHGRPPLTDPVGDSVTDRGTLPEPSQGIPPEESSGSISPNGTADLTPGLENSQPEEPTDEPAPNETHDDLTPDETRTNPDPGLDNPDPEDTVSEETLPHQQPLRPLNPETAGMLGEAVFDLSSSYATENNLHDPSRSSDAERNTLFLRMDHLPAEIAGAKLPAMLWVEEYDLWQSLFPGLSAHTNEDYSVLDVSLSNYDNDFFKNHSLLILFTEGRSGSVRYRLDDTAANHMYVKATLTAGVPAANTMDIAYWCVMVPVAKPKNGETNRLVFLETQDVPMDSFEEFVTLSPEIYRGLWFYGSRDGSYERDGYLYGRMANMPEIKQYPSTETFTSYEEWQARYGGCYTYLLNKKFYEGICAIDEAFFAQKSLVVVYLKEPGGSIHHRVDGTTAEGGSLTVRITSLDAGGDEDMGYWAILIPIDKELDSLPVTLEKTEQFCTWEEYEAWPEWQNWEILEEE